MKVTYDPYADAVYIKLTDEKHDLETRLVDDWVAVDIGRDRAVFGFEILEASKRLDLEQLKHLEFVEYGEPIRYVPIEDTVAVSDQTLSYETASSE